MTPAWPRTAALAPTAVALACLLAATACGDDPPAGSQKVEVASAVGDCLRPDPAREGGFVQARCGGDATVEITDIVERSGSGPYCPAGTDVVADGAQGTLSGGRIDGPVSVWCLRNLAPPHPGDPGMGGGELVADDCFVMGEPGGADTDQGAAVTEVACTGGATAPQYRLQTTASRTEDCPAERSTPIELTAPRRLVLCGDALEGN
jgi:hypothetical protein